MGKKSKKNNPKKKHPPSKNSNNQSTNNNGNKNEERLTRKQLKKERAKGGKYGRHSRAEEIRFEEQLNQKGCWIKVINGDGNCLFRSLADQLEGNQALHLSFRSEIVNFMNINKEYFEPYIEDDESFDDYIIRMGKQSEWGGYQELYAASQLYKIHIVVHQLEAESLTFIYNKVEDELSNFSRQSSEYKYFSSNANIYTCHISYHGEQHYNSVRNLREKQQTVKATSKMAMTPARLPLNLEGTQAIDLRSLSIREEKVEPSNNASSSSVTCSSDKEETVSKKKKILLEKVDDEGETEKEGKDLKDTTTTEKSKKKNGIIPIGPCPCGSGRKYRKCCKKTDKKILQENSKSIDRSSTASTNSSDQDANNAIGKKQNEDKKPNEKAFQSIIL